jgi:uncharacterized repeat protein (TIGR01451 family)
MLKAVKVFLVILGVLTCSSPNIAFATGTPAGTYYTTSQAEYTQSSVLQSTSVVSFPFTVVVPELTSTLSFKAFSLVGSSDNLVLNGTDVSTSDTPQGPFVNANNTVLTNLGINIGQPVPLVNVNTIRDGQVVFVELQDEKRNLSSTVIDTAIVTISTIASGLTAQNAPLGPNLLSLDNQKVIRLYETGPNSGVFLGYIIFRAESTNTSGNVEIVVNSNTLIVANYRENNTGVTEQDFLNFDAQVSAEGRAFNTLTGRLINGLNVSLIDAVNAVPANVYNADGHTQFPSLFKTGTDTLDASGGMVNVDDGEYIFPYVNPGQYRLRITNLDKSLIFPSTATQSDIFNLGIQNPIIESGSYGGVFTINTPRSVGIDLPIDTLANVTVEKTADKNTASPGDMVTYTLNITNHERNSLTNLTLIDDSPLDVRFLPGSLTINGIVSKNVTVNTNTGRLTAILPAMQTGERFVIKYAMRLLPKIKHGTILRNAAQVTGTSGFISNVSFADVRVVDDMLQSKATIVGRVYFDDCNGSNKNDIGEPDIIGLKNIRIYNQQGDYVLTDSKGKFSFSGIETGTNVIQLDKITLPEGVKVSFCNDNTRSAGTEFSKFVDTRGGNIYKVNFTLSGDKEKYRPIVIEDNVAELAAALTPEQQRILLQTRAETSPAYRYNATWLETQKNDFKLVYPNESNHPGITSLSFGFKYPTGMKPKVYLNDEMVSQLNLLAIDNNEADTVRLAHYSGIDLEKDLNTLRIELYNEDGKFIDKILYQVSYSQEIYKIIPLPKKNILVANGITPPKIVFKLKDKNNTFIGKGKSVTVQISEPYKLFQAQQIVENTAMNNVNAGQALSDVDVGDNGTLAVLLQPTLVSGRVTVKVFLNQKDFEEFDFWISPEKREWILVGLAQSSLGYQTVKGNIKNASNEKIDEDLNSNGKVQFYTKGTIDKKWLITASFDNQRHKKTSREELFGQIDLNEQFSVVGDYSERGIDAASQYPLYLKIEKDQFYTLFGDYNTDLGSSKLLPYARTLSGFKTAYKYDNYSVQFFGAKDGQTLLRDDIPLLGTGEIYKLSGLNLVRGSDRVHIQIRDNRDYSKLISNMPISRFLDYNINYQDGTLSFTPSFFLNYNTATERPFLVVEAETFGDTQEKNTFGSRFASAFFGNDIKTGVNLIRDGGNIRTQGKGTSGGSIDADIQLTKNAKIYAEYGMSKGDDGTRVGDFGLLGNNIPLDNNQGTAQFIEFTNKGDNLFTRAYYRSQDNGFGIGTGSSFDVARQSYGLETIYDFSQDKGKSKQTKETSTLNDLKNGLSLYAKLNEDADTAGRGSIATAEIGTKKQSTFYSAYTGLRLIKEDISFGYNSDTARQTFNSNSSLSQLISGGEAEIIDNRLSVFGGNELPINDSEKTQSIYGNKSFLGFQAKPFQLTNVIVSNEWVDLNGEEYQNASASVVVTPMAGLDLSVNGTNHMLPDDELSSLASSINKSIKVTNNVDMNLNYTHKEAIGGREGIFTTLNNIPDYYLPFFMRDASVRSPINYSSTGYWEDYDLVGIGLSQQGQGWRHNFSTEYKSAETENRFSVGSSVLGEITNSYTVGLRGNYQLSRFKNGITIDSFKEQLETHSQNLGLNLAQYADNNTLNFLKDSQIAQIIGGSAYRPDGEDGVIVLHRTLLEKSDNASQDSQFKLVNNFALQSDITDKLQNNTQYAHKLIQNTYQKQNYEDFINILGTEWRYDIAKEFDISTQGTAYYSADTKILDYSYGFGGGYIPTRNVRIRIGYNVQGFRDSDFNAFGYTAQGPYIAFDMKFDQEDVKDRLEQFMSGIRG